MDPMLIDIRMPDGKGMQLKIPFMAYEMNGMNAFGNVLNTLEREVKAYQAREKAKRDAAREQF